MIMIRDYRLKKGWTMKELGDRVGVSESAISLYELGKRKIKYEMLLKLSEELGTDVNHLLGRGDFPPPVVSDNTVKIPVLGEIAAGYDSEDYEDYSIGDMEVPPAWLHGRPVTDYFFLKVSGDSMFPMYQDGDYVLILRQSTMNYSGQIGAVVYDDNKTTLKKVEYVYGEDWMRLVPINPSFPPVMVRDEKLEHCRVIGIAKMVIREVH